MNREIKNNGEYLEVDSDCLLSQIEAMNTAQILVVKKSRLELAGDDKQLFVKRLMGLAEKHSIEISKLPENQKCDFLLRKMICENPYCIVMAPAPGG